MTALNESQIFCEIESFILSILEDEISIEQFKQQIIALIKKSRRFFIEGNNYIAAIIIFKHIEQMLLKAIQFKFYETIQDLPDHVIEQLIQHVQAQAELMAADYQSDQKQHHAQLKKAERFLLESMQHVNQLTVFPMRFGIKSDALSVIRLYDMDSYLSAFLKLIRARDVMVFRYIHSVIWQLKHDPAQGYYLQFFCIYTGHEIPLTDCARRIGEHWLEITNDYGTVQFEEYALKGISVDCQVDSQIQRALQTVRASLSHHARTDYLRVLRHRRKSFDCERIGLNKL